MATKKNDIALSFDRAEYYTLQEASEYLNRKHGIDNITPRKLLKHSMSYDTPIFVFAKGFNIYIDFKKSFHYKNREDFNLSDTENIINGLIKYHGALLKVSQVQLRHTFFSKGYHDGIEVFDGVVSPYNINFDPYMIVNLDNFTLHPYMNIKNDNDIERIKKLSSIKFDLYALDKTKSKLYPYFNICTDDLIILNKDLEKLAKQVAENAPIPDKEQPNFADISSLLGGKGISPKKAQAKLIANTHAQHLWSKDHDKKIRIGEMCENVWNYLIHTKYQTELPAERESLKDWLTDIPPYASQAGRPSNS
jgi:hypothetical protein